MNVKILSYVKVYQCWKITLKKLFFKTTQSMLQGYRCFLSLDFKFPKLLILSIWLSLKFKRKIKLTYNHLSFIFGGSQGTRIMIYVIELKFTEGKWSYFLIGDFVAKLMWKQDHGQCWFKVVRSLLWCVSIKRPRRLSELFTVSVSWFAKVS